MKSFDEWFFTNYSGAIYSECELRKMRDEFLPIWQAAQEAQQKSLNDDLQDLVSKAMVKSYQLGQLYWQQADSESIRQQNKSIETQYKLENLIDDTIKAIGIGN